MSTLRAELYSNLTEATYEPKDENQKSKEENEAEEDRASNLSRSKTVLDHTETVLAVDKRRRRDEDARQSADR